MIDVPKGMLRLATLKLLSESSMSGTDLARSVDRLTSGAWRPGPGSVYLVLAELLRRRMITELPKREGNTRRYIISAAGKEELSRLVKETETDVARQLKLLAVYSSLGGRAELKEKIGRVAEDLSLTKA